jgi:predicted PurR-regulated permease PerM
MTILKTAFNELIGLFVDDGALALSAFVLILLVIGAVKFAGANGLVAAIILLVGCIVIVAESIARAARKRYRRKP